MIDNQYTHEKLKEICVFLSDYAAQLIASGAPTARIENCLHTIAKAWNTHAEFSILPSHIIINVWNNDRTQSYSSIGRVRGSANNYKRIVALSRMATDTEVRHYTLTEARIDYANIMQQTTMNKWLLTAMVACANASFCKLFGGDWGAMAIVWIATADGFFLKQQLTKQHWDYRAVTIVVACIAAILSCVGYVFPISNTPDIALGTSVLFLVPGIPFGNAVNDFINGHYLCGLSRFLTATMITFCLSIGLCIALLLTHISM